MWRLIDLPVIVDDVQRSFSDATFLTWRLRCSLPSMTQTAAACLSRMKSGRCSVILKGRKSNWKVSWCWRWIVGVSYSLGGFFFCHPYHGLCNPSGCSVLVFSILCQSCVWKLTDHLLFMLQILSILINNCINPQQANLKGTVSGYVIYWRCIWGLVA